MKNFKIILLLLFYTQISGVRAQCTNLTSSLIIASGYDYISSTTLSLGSTDKNWIITSDPDASTNEPREAYCVTYSGGWAAPGQNSTWINGYNSNTVSCNACTYKNYEYEYKFCLKSVSNPTLLLKLMSDDFADLYLNGNYIDSSQSNVSQKSVTITTNSLFVIGTNIITVKLRDMGGIYVGLNVTGTLTSSSNSIYPKTPNLNLNSIYVNGNLYDISTQTVTSICNNQLVNLAIEASSCSYPIPDSEVFTWDFGDGTSANGKGVSHLYTSPGIYYITMSTTYTNAVCGPTTFSVEITDCGPGPQCDKCISSFAPDPGDYIISLWAKEDYTTAVSSYSTCGVEISFTNSSLSYLFYHNPIYNKMIDGWQRIEGRFTVPPTASDLKIKLFNNATSTDAYFDDIRIHPVDANMKSYVYDPITLRLAAELDENNYATFYEYNEEGQLIRVKKETEQGIMTIKETRSSNKKP